MPAKNRTLAVGAIAGAVAFIVLLFLGASASVVTTGSGGLGAVSFGIDEALLEGVAVGLFVGFAYWLQRRLRRRTPATRP